MLRPLLEVVDDLREVITQRLVHVPGHGLGEDRVDRDLRERADTADHVGDLAQVLAVDDPFRGVGSDDVLRNLPVECFRGSVDPVAEFLGEVQDRVEGHADFDELRTSVEQARAGHAVPFPFRFEQAEFNRPGHPLRGDLVAEEVGELLQGM